MSWEVIEGLRCELGESPVWDGDRLLLLDIPGRLLHLVEGDRVRAVGLSERVTAIVPGAEGWLAVYGRSLGSVDLRTGAVTTLLTIPGPADVELNDAVVGRDGRLYTGSVDRSMAGRGEIYSIDARLQVEVVATGVGAANGMDTSPDGATLVYADTFADRVTIGIGGPTLEVPHPDGLVVDAEGGIWVASWGHGRILRFDREGRLDRVLELPVANVASLAFGGADLDVLFVTTARSHLGDGGGAVYRQRQDVRGLVPHRFSSPP